MGTVATTAHGDVQGVEDQGAIRFSGLPFAAPVIGGRRFRATMALDETVEVVDDPESTRRQLWDGVL